MGFHLPLILALFSLAAVALANHAAQPAPQLYWNSVLPNTQMPRSISELLHPDSKNEEKSTNMVNAIGKPEVFPLSKKFYQKHNGRGEPESSPSERNDQPPQVQKPPPEHNDQPPKGKKPPPENKEPPKGKKPPPENNEPPKGKKVPHIEVPSGPLRPPRKIKP